MNKPVVATICAVLMAGCLGAFRSESTHTLPVLSDVVLDRVIGEGEWDDALHFSGAFHIVGGGELDGRFPFDIFLGAADDGALLIAARVSGLDGNPYQPPGQTWPEYLEVYLSDNSTELRAPSDWISVGSAPQGSMTNDGYWTGRDWAVQSMHNGGRFNEGRPTSGRWGRTGVEGSVTSWEIYIGRTSFTSEDAFQGLDGDPFRILFMLQRAGPAADPNGHVLVSSSWPATERNAERDPANWLEVSG